MQDTTEKVIETMFWFFQVFIFHELWKLWRLDEFAAYKAVRTFENILNRKSFGNETWPTNTYRHAQRF